MKIKKTNRKGMTLVEIIVTLAIASLVIQVLYSVFFAGNKFFEFSKNRGFAQRDIRLATDFINSELRYIDKLDNEPLEGKYYSLEIKNNEANDGTYSLVKREYGGANPIEGTLIRSIDGKGLISIENKEDEGKIKSTFEESGYKTIFKLSLANKTELKSGVEISSDSENKIIYYSINSDNFKVAIGDPDHKEDAGDEGNPDDVGGEESINWKQHSSYEIGDRVKHNGKLYEAVKEDKTNLSYHAPGSDGWVYQIWREVSGFWLKVNVYYENDTVLYKDKIYIAKQETKGNEPDKTNWAWEEIQKWEQDKKYGQGDKVWYSGDVYKSQKKNNVFNPNKSTKGWDKIN